MRKLILTVAAFATLALAVAMPPPKEEGGAFQQVNSQQYDVQAMYAIYIAPLAEPELTPVSVKHDVMDEVQIAAGKRSSGTSERRSRSEGASALFIDKTRPRPLIL